MPGKSVSIKKINRIKIKHIKYIEKIIILPETRSSTILLTWFGLVPFFLVLFILFIYLLNFYTQDIAPDEYFIRDSFIFLTPGILLLFYRFLFSPQKTLKLKKGKLFLIRTFFGLIKHREEIPMQEYQDIKIKEANIVANGDPLYSFTIIGKSQEWRMGPLYYKDEVEFLKKTIKEFMRRK